MITALQVAGQVLGAAALLLGLFWLVGLPVTLLVAGSLVLVLCTAAEFVRAPRGPGAKGGS